MKPWIGSGYSRALVKEKFNYVVIAKNVTRLPVPLRFPRVIGKMRTPDKLHACAVCVNGKPVPISAKRTRETHETALQLRRLGKPLGYKDLRDLRPIFYC